MRKLLLALVFSVFATLSTSAQTTTVSGTVTDPNGNVYANGTVAAALIYPSGSNPSVNPSSGPFPLTSLGAFSFSIGDNNVITPANTNWVFTFCANSVNLGPGANIVKVCFNTPPLFITGPTQNITGLLGTPAILGPQLTGTGGFAPGGDLTGSSTSQNVVGLHFGSNPIPLSASTPTGCMQVTAGVLGGTGTNCPTVGGVSSVYGRAGAVTAQSGDYTCGQITGCTPGGGGSPAGPAPVYDVQNAAYGAIPYTSSIAGESTTATCTAGNSHCTLGAAKNFVNGEGVVITTGGAVTAQTIPAAPTVTNPSVTGSSTFHYKCLPLGVNGDFPGATAATAITNAPNIFGAPQVVISSISLTANLVTVNATGINAVSGEYESVSGVTGAGAGWNGFWKVVTGGANSFTYNLTSANGTGTVSGQSFAQRTNTRGITAYTRTSDGVIHITTDGNHNFTASGTNQPTLAILNGTSPLDFNGIYAVLTASGNTMTLQSAISPSVTETGSVTTGFTTVTVYEEIIVTCPNVSGSTVNYAVYGDSPNGGTSVTYLGETMYGQSTFVDWGPFLAGSPQRRSYVPTSPPASAQAALFRGVIQAGGGTTSITLTTNITTTPIAGALILHDESAQIAAAMSAAAAGGGTVYLSPSSAAGSTCQYAINYPLSIPQFVGVYLGCGVLGNEPVTRNGYNHIFYDGTLSASNVSTPQFGSATYVPWSGVAKEFLTGSSFDQADRISGIVFGSTLNGQNFLVFSGPGGYNEVGWSYFSSTAATGGTDVGITFLSGSSDHLHDLASQLYGPLGQGGPAGSQTGLMPFTPPQVPAIWLRGSDQGGGSNFVGGGNQLTIDGKNTLNGRGVLYDETFCSNCTAQKLRISNNWNQGPTQPQLMFYGNDGGTNVSDVMLSEIQLDSTQIACFGDWARQLGPTVIDNCTTSGGPNIGLVTGNVTPQLTVYGLIANNAVGQNTSFILYPSSGGSAFQIATPSFFYVNTPVFNIDASGNVTANSYNFDVSAPIIWKAPEGSCTGAQTGQDVLCIGDSTTHQILESDNNGAFLPHLKGTGAFTVGHGVQVQGTNPLVLQDNGASAQSPAPNQVNFYASPNCGTQTNCTAISTTGDNNAAFTALFALSNASTATVNPNDVRTAPQAAVNGASPVQSLVVSATNFPGDTAYVFIADSNGSTFTVSDGTTNSYSKIAGPTNFAGCCQMQVFSSTTAKIFDSVTVTTVATAEDVSASVIVLPGVTSQTIGTSASGSSTAPSVSQSASANSMEVSGCSWWNNATINLSANQGTLRTNIGAVVAHLGIATWGTFSSSPGTVTNSGTLGSTAPWGCLTLNAIGGGTTQANPVIDIARGYYFYSGGINPTIPTTIRCEPGTFLHYTGTGHAADLGPVGGYAAGQGPLVPGTYIDGCTFTGGSQMTEGIYMQPLTTVVGIRNSTFLDFGNATSFMIYGTCDNWDVEIGPQNRFIIDDFQGRQIFSTNNSACDANSFTRFHDNAMFCQGGHGQAAGTTVCTVAQNGAIGVILDSAKSRFYHNNISGGWNPDLWLRCSNTPCFGDTVVDNQIEAPTGGAPVPPIQFSTGVDQLMVNHNSVNLHSLSESFIGPRTGTDVLTDSRINWNQIASIALATPLIALNNVAGNTGNQSLGNGCSTGGSPHLPCALLHTTGGNINQWNPDTYPTLTFAAGTTASYSFSTTYGVAPFCTIPPNIPGAATTLTITTLSTTTLTITASASNSSTVHAVCSAGDGQ